MSKGKEKLTKKDESRPEQAPLTLDQRIVNLEAQIHHQEAIVNQMIGALALCRELKSLEKKE